MPSKINYGVNNLESWNPIKVRMPDGTLKGYHCTKISDGCADCFAEKMNLNRRFGWANLIPYDNRKVEFAIDEKLLAKPLSWKKPRTIFVCDMCDLFHGEITEPQISDVLQTAYHSVDDLRHKYLILTKRPKRMAKVLKLLSTAWNNHFAYGKHLYLGVTVCNQQEADEKIIDICNWLSLEPLLGPIDMHLKKHPNIKWVIAGGESGPGARPSHPDWFRKSRDDCQAAGVPFFFKQWGEWKEIEDGGYSFEEEKSGRVRWVLPHRPPDEPVKSLTPNTVMMRRIGKKKAGRLLDGREWNETPWQREE